jgi:hypothetical protein
MAVHDIGAVPARGRSASRPPLRVRRSGLVAAGVAAGALAGTVLGFAWAGSRLGLPLLLGLLGAIAGGCIGVLIAEHRARRPVVEEAVEAKPEPLLPVVEVAPALPAPEGAPAEPTWLPDPEDPERRRLWDGSQWTSHVWRPRRVAA